MVFIICLLVTVGVIGLQGFWLRNFYRLNKDRFEKEVNLALEDAVKKEFTNRNDSIERLIYRFMMDTAEIIITSKRNLESGEQMYQVAHAKNLADYFSFSRKELDFPITSQQDSNKAKVALAAARLEREDDLDHHIIFYRTQNLGGFLQNKKDHFDFDTARCRFFLYETLQQRGIHEQFVFALKDEDNTLNRNYFPDRLIEKYPVITKAFPTYNNKKGENYVRALFPPPNAYLFSRTINLVAGSAVLLLIVSLSFFYLIKIITREKKLSAIKNDFINHITHEFKTPIATIYSAVQALDEFNMVEDPVKTKKYLRISKTELERLSDLVTKVLHISLYEQPNFQIRREEIDLDKMVNEVIQVHIQATGGKAVISYTNQAPLATIKGDAAHLYNGISNLVDNAIKFSSDSTPVEISLFESGKWLVLSVKDSGRGIKEEHLEFIFDKFYRVPQNAHTTVKGFGLGLSYLKEVIEKHKGWCRVESEYGKGSIFTFGLPLIHEK